jgi:DNA-binding phage protein
MKNKLDQFAGRLEEWRAEGKTLAEMVKALKEDGCCSSTSAISAFLLRRDQERMEQEFFAQIATGGRMNRELDEAYKQNPEPAIEQLIRMNKTLIMSLQVHGANNPKLLNLANSMQQTVLQYLSGKTRAELEARKIDLAESKYRDLVSEKKAAIQSEMDRARSSGGISEETREKIERELKLL